MQRLINDRAVPGTEVFFGKFYLSVNENQTGCRNNTDGDMSMNIDFLDYH